MSDAADVTRTIPNDFNFCLNPYIAALHPNGDRVLDIKRAIALAVEIDGDAGLPEVPKLQWNSFFTPNPKSIFCNDSLASMRSMSR